MQASPEGLTFPVSHTLPGLAPFPRARASCARQPRNEHLSEMLSTPGSLLLPRGLRGADRCADPAAAPGGCPVPDRTVPPNPLPFKGR